MLSSAPWSDNPNLRYLEHVQKLTLRHIVDGCGVVPGPGDEVAPLVSLSGNERASTHGHILHRVRNRSRVTARGGTVIAFDDAHVTAIGPVQVFARDRVTVVCKRTSAGAPVVRREPGVRVIGLAIVVDID